MEWVLPEDEFVPEMNGIPKDFSMILFGPPKVGKTTLAASASNSLVLECEPGGCKYIKCRKVDVDSLTDLREYHKLLQTDARFDTIVIDSLDRVAQWFEDDICKEFGITSILDTKKGERFGSQWGAYAEKVLTFIAAWQKIGKRTIFLAHTKKAELSDGTVINPKTINLYGQTASRVMSLVENIGYIYAGEDKDGKIKRYLSFRPGIHVEAGSRHPALTDRIVELPKENPYAAFEALFGPPVEKNGSGNGAKHASKKGGK